MSSTIQSGVLSQINRCLLVFVVLSLMMLKVINAQGEENTLTPELRSLVGMRIPANAQGMQGDVPGWFVMGSYALSAPKHKLLSMGVEELYRDDVSIFVIDIVDEMDWSRTILDVQVLPQNMLWYDIKNSNIVPKKDEHMYSFNSMCKRADSQIIVGLMRPELGKEDCTHYSKQVLRAWEIDPQIGRITEIPVQGVSCFRGDAEYSCE